MTFEVPISKFPPVAPNTDLPKQVTLRGASGSGFAFGQMLCRMHSSDRSHPIVVVRRFLPITVNDGAPTTAPWAYQTRPFAPENNQIKAGWVYVIVDVESNSVGGTHCRVRHLTPAEGEDDIILHWHKMDLDRFRLDEDTMFVLTVLTGLAYKGRTLRASKSGRRLVNFIDADEVDMDSSMLPPDEERPESYWIWKEQQRQEERERNKQWTSSAPRSVRPQQAPTQRRSKPPQPQQPQHKSKSHNRPLNAVRAAFDGLLNKLHAA